jgi:isocitrate dehydrogenase
MIELVTPKGDMLLSVNELARNALDFVAQTTPVFYVRELPGDLEDDEKIALVATLVEYKLLRVAS